MNIRRQILGLFTAASLLVAAPAFAHPVFQGDDFHRPLDFDARVAFRDDFAFHNFAFYYTPLHRPDDLRHPIALVLDDAVFAIGRREPMPWQAQCWWCSHWDAKPEHQEPTAAVPEPGSVALLGLAALALFVWRRKPSSTPL